MTTALEISLAGGREKGRQGRREILVQIKSRTRLSASLEFLSKM